MQLRVPLDLEEDLLALRRDDLRVHYPVSLSLCIEHSLAVSCQAHVLFGKTHAARKSTGSQEARRQEDAP
jgi:hypothetical protein